MRPTSSRRWWRRCLAAAGGVVLGALVAPGTATVGHADVFSRFAVVNGTATAAADHELAASSAFPNFSPGAVDNYYPLAHAHVDNSPFSEGTASPVDTGPLGVTGLGTAGQAPPQYADERYPPQAKGPASFGVPGGPYAVAVAGPGAASAEAVAGSSPPPTPSATSATGPGPAASAASPGDARTAWLAALEAALAHWRQVSFTPAWNAAHPMVAPDASSPDTVDGNAADASVTVDAAKGLVVTGDSRVSAASFGGGVLQIRQVHVAVTITNDGFGTPTAQVTVDVGAASVAGVPVSIGAQGISVVGQQVATLQPVQQVTAQLNAILEQAGITVSTVAPATTASAHQLTVDATGVRIDVQQPSLPGIPTQSVRHVLGEVFADALAEQAPASSASAPPVAGAPQGGSQAQTIYVPGLPGTPGSEGGVPAASPPSPSVPAISTTAPGPPMLRVVAAKPFWLLLLYFLWQVLVLGTATSLWWWRRARGVAS